MLYIQPKPFSISQMKEELSHYSKEITVKYNGCLKPELVGISDN